MRPDRPKEGTAGHFFDARINGRRAVLGPVRSPSPLDHIGVKVVAFLMEKSELRGRRGVVPFEGLLTGRVDQRMGHAEGRHEIVNAVLLGQSSAHRSPAYQIFPTKIDHKTL